MAPSLKTCASNNKQHSMFYYHIHLGGSGVFQYKVERRDSLLSVDNLWPYFDKAVLAEKMGCSNSI